MKRILIATGLYSPDIGGPATYTQFLERHLPARGYTLSVVAFTQVRSFPKVIRHCVYAWRLWKKGLHADILYALDTVSVGVPTYLVSVFLGTPYFLRVPGDYAWEQGQHRWGITQTLDEYMTMKGKSLPWQVRLLAWVQKGVAKRAARVIVPSEYMRSVVTRWGVHEDRVIRIYSALAPLVLSETRLVYRQKYGYDGFVIVTAARLTPWKGIHTLISTVATLRREGVPVSCEIIGEGEERTSLEKHIQTAHAEEYVHLRGQKKKDELAERIFGADVFVLNTSYEGLSHQLLEVMSLGVPIITTPVGGNRELLDDQETGLFVPYNDERALREALLHVRSAPEEAYTRARKAQERVRSFREESLIDDIVRVFS